MKISAIHHIVKTSMLLFAALTVFSSCEGELELVQSIDEEFSGVEQIEIESSFMEVNYEGRADQSTVTLDGRLESSRPGNFRIKYKQEGKTLSIELDRSGVVGSGNNRAVINLLGPKVIDLDVESGSGNTMVSGIEFPRLELSAGSGNIKVASSKVTNFDLEVGSGRIEGLNLIGNVEADASSGKLEFDQVKGNLDIESSSGAIVVKDVEGKVNIQLSSGDVNLTNISEIEGLKVSSGNISGTGIGLGAKTRLYASSGRISIQTISNLNGFNYDFEAGSGRVTVGQSSSSGSLKINNGAPYTISGSVSSGLIEIKN